MTQRSKRRVEELHVIEHARLLVHAAPSDWAPILRDLRTAVAFLDALDLEAPTAVHTNAKSPETAHEAAEWMKPRVGRTVGQVFAQIAVTGGLTTDQIEQRLNWSHQTVSPRVTELRDNGWVEDSGRRRKTRSGREAAVWQVTQIGAKAMALVPNWRW